MPAPFFAACCLIALATPPMSVDGEAPDLRDAYDVETYRLDLRVDPATKSLSGEVGIEARVVAESLDVLVLDLAPNFDVMEVRLLDAALQPTGELAGAKLAFTRDKGLLTCALGAAAKKGASLRVAIVYSGHPKERDDFAGFHWSKTKDGKPWISTSCQDEGSASWWPSKDSFFNPEDKPARVLENYTVPKGLYAVGNGRLASRDENADDTETFHWVHEYPLETYSVTLDVAPYVVVEQPLTIEGIDGTVPFIYYVLPENAEKAALQFQDVPKMIEIYSKYFGPYPFPKSKYALVETSFWGMEHSTAVAYGSSYPAWIAQHGGKDRWASRNRFFDYILVHESAHEWWGNAVSAKAWGDFWIHEGFATYAERVYLEFTQGPEIAQIHMNTWKSSIGKKSRLYRGKDVDSGQAYDQTIYGKGAWVLSTLRQFIQDDDAFWRTLRAFHLEFRYKNADSHDFRAVLERETKSDWKTFFDEWIYGAGYPKLAGTVRADANTIHIEIENVGTAKDGFHVPLDLAWHERDARKTKRTMLAPGKNDVSISCATPPTEIKIVGLDRVLCDDHVKVE